MSQSHGYSLKILKSMHCTQITLFIHTGADLLEVKVPHKLKNHSSWPYPKLDISGSCGLGTKSQV
jgi:hypothetical protein